MGMKLEVPTTVNGLPVCLYPTDPKAIYIRGRYQMFFWGPFADENAVSEAINKLDASGHSWDDDSFSMIYGANPLPKDCIDGLRNVPGAMRDRVEKQRVGR